MSFISSSKKKIALVDCNSFYVSCERLFNPKIQNVPVVVLSNNDGCVISRSTEAKKIGIKMGEPYFKVKELIPFITNQSLSYIRKSLFERDFYLTNFCDKTTKGI